MSQKIVGPLRVTLAFIAVGTLVMQTQIPVLAIETGNREPEVSHLVVPYSIAGILVVVSCQVALVAIWKMLSMVAANRIFTSPALRWVNIIIGCATVATAIGSGSLAHLLFIEQLGPPTTLAIYLVGGIAVVLVLFVLRGLLAAAIADRDELNEVI